MNVENFETCIEFLMSKSVCVISTLMEDGSPHNTVMHYSMDRDNHLLYLSTDDTTLKIKNLRFSEKSALVVGWSEEDWISIQMRGTTSILKDAEDLARIKQIHYMKHPNSQKFEHDVGTVFLVFHPNWIRYSDLGQVPAIIYEFINI